MSKLLKFVSANRAKARKARKAQVGSEMLFGVGVVLLIFILLIPINITKRAEVRDTADFLEKNVDCKTFVNILARVASTENLNVTATFKHPISTAAGSKIVDSEGVLCNSLITLPDLSLTKGDVEIRNVNGGIRIQNV